MTVKDDSDFDPDLYFRAACEAARVAGSYSDLSVFDSLCDLEYKRLKGLRNVSER